MNKQFFILLLLALAAYGQQTMTSVDALPSDLDALNSNQPEALADDDALDMQANKQERKEALEAEKRRQAEKQVYDAYMEELKKTQAKESAKLVEEYKALDAEKQEQIRRETFEVLRRQQMNDSLEQAKQNFEEAKGAKMENEQAVKECSCVKEVEEVKRLTLFTFFMSILASITAASMAK